MTTLPTPIADALEEHKSFSPVDDATYALETTVFEARVTATAAEGPRDGSVTVVVRLPTLDAATADRVAPVVEDGWFETLERRLADVFTVAETDTHDAPQIDHEDGVVTVTLEYVAWDAREGVDDAKALIEYVEGTYAQGIIPGYEYEGPAATLLENAQTAGERAAEGAAGGHDDEYDSPF
ncbi:DUF5813 family protein [Natronosalvus halobius]|uniref:DUF5813 family protein n=1 Tax=Natronosalvus halobius TaxID=2953746 RepID=UPI00209E7BD1|nr:DUF5813 family protein [Natronosalvus halobius]USZ73050.1 DUF5813 family protein [Natronosalvus halobius]